MSSKARWILAFALAAAIVWLARDCLDGPPPSAVANRVWIERLPTDETDLIGQFMLVEERRGRLGLTGKASRWRQDFEIFQWSLEDERLVQEFPQSKTRRESTVRVWECEAPEPFDLCLDLESSAGKLRYYSARDWVIRPDASVTEITDQPELEGVIPSRWPGSPRSRP